MHRNHASVSLFTVLVAACCCAAAMSNTRDLTSTAPDGYAVFEVRPLAVAPGYARIEDALRAATAYKQKHTDAALRIQIAPGDYYLTEPIRISGVLSGSQKYPTQIVAVSPEQPPRLLAGRRVELQWQLYRDGIWRAHLDGATFDQLYVNGKAQIRARYPNFDPHATVLGGFSASALEPARVARWKNPVGAVLQALHEKRWGGMQIPIEGKFADGRLIFGKALGNNRPSPPHITYRYVENVFEELDAPGEWYFDATQSTLYLMPPIGVDLNKAKIELSGAARVLDLQGDATIPLRFVRIAGLKIEHTGTSFLSDSEPLLRSDWMIAREGAIYLERTEDIRIEDNELTALGGNAIFVSGYNRRADITGNHIHDVGGGGIDFVGRPDAVRSPSFRYEDFVPIDKIDRTAGPKSDDYPAQSVAQDNLIDHIGTIEKQVAGVEISTALDVRVAHNSIYDVPRAGINVGDGTFGGHVIEFNDVFDTVLETGDHGAFNAWGRDRFWHPERKIMDQINAQNPDLWKLDVIAPITLRNNRFRCDHGWDIDLDDGSSNYRIYDNVLLSGGLKFREGFSREAWNNVIVNNSFHPHVWFKNSGDKFEHNIVMSSYQPVLVEHWDAMIDRNLFPNKQALDNARKLGLDAHSTFGDAQFVDAERGDFRVAPTSPALTLGFKNFEMNQFGVTSARLKVLAKSAPIPELVSAAAAAPDKTYTFFGSEVKSVTSLGEQSAAGLADIKGVLVLRVASGSAAEKSGLLANDVITEAPADQFGSQLEQVDTVQDLQRLASARAWRGELPIVVMRNQKRVSLTLKTAQE